MQLALILSVVAPALVAAALVLAGLRPWESPRAEGGRWALALAPGACALAAYMAVRGLPALPPSGSSDKLVWLTLLASIYGAAEPRLPSSARWAGRVLLAVGAPLYLVGGTDILLSAAVSAAILAAWAGYEAAAEKLRAPAAHASLAALGFGVATALGTSGSALLAQTGGGITVAATVGLAACAWLAPKLVSAPGVAAGYIVGFGSLGLAGLKFANLLPVAAGLIVVAGLVPWLFTLPRVRPAGLRLVLSAGGLAFALSTAAIASGILLQAPAETEESDDYDYGY